MNGESEEKVMKHKLGIRLFAAGMALVMALGLLGTSALAAGTVNSVKEKTGTNGQIVVTVYDQNPGNAGTGAPITEGLSNPVEGVGINALRIGSVVELTSTDTNNKVTTQVAFGLSDDIFTLLGLAPANAIASQNDTHYFAPEDVQTAVALEANQATIEAYLDGQNNGAENQVTGTDGVATFDSLNYGLYLLAKSGLPADATTDLVPFLVSVPMYVNNAWTNTVYAYPKVRTDDITISKTVDDQDGAAYAAGDIYVNAGQTLKYTVTTTIPAAATGNGSANGFTSFAITDTNTSSTLDIDTNSVQVKLGETVLTKDTQYTVSYTGSVLTITLTNTQTTGGLAALNANLSTEQTITVTYNAAVATDVAFSSKLTNTAKATYQRDGMESIADTAEAKVDLYTYGIDLTKTLSDGDDTISPNTISFELYKDNQGQLGAKIPVASGTGSYWMAATEETSPVVMYVGTDGALKLYGLEPGTYHLKETATMDGYTLLDAPITIVITATNASQGGEVTATATVNGANAQVTNGLVSLSVENTKNDSGFNLPQTGGAGTLLLTAVGLGLLSIGVILLAMYRKKGNR